MNEVTRIHLDRQPFAISIEAHKLLKAYIAAIERQVHDKDVLKEVELRMAELLTERGITGDKVILEEDVDYLKQQLGDPEDFGDNDGETDAPADKPSEAKQLFRDPENGMIAGVSAGLAAYFGIDVILFRVLFVIATFAGGWGLLIYIALWLLVPPVKTGSDRLRMRGESVTLNSLKEVVERADAKGAAKRAGNTVAPMINTAFHIILKITGVAFIVGSLAVLFGLIAVRAYMAVHNGQLFEENLFPVSTTEHILANLVLGLVALIAVFGIICGLAVYKRRWPIGTWVTGVIVGIFFIGLAAASALAADAAPRVRDRYFDQTHTVSRSVEPFQDVTFVGEYVDYRWEYADTYSVRFDYFDSPDISKIKTTVNDDVLYINTLQYDHNRNCSMPCLFPQYDLQITVSGPRPLANNYTTFLPAMPALPEATKPQ